VHRIDTPNNLAGLFRAPNPPLTGPVVIDSAWLNDVQENLCNVITSANVALVKGNYFQLSSVLRVRLQAPLTVYVQVAGNDANAGTIGSPWLTIQHAINVIQTQYDLNGFNVTISCAGAFTAGCTVNAPFVGAGTVSLVNGSSGDSITVAAGNAVTVSNGARLTITGMTLSATAGGAVGLLATLNGIATIGAGTVFAACGQAHIAATYGGQTLVSGAYTVTGGAQQHAQAFGGQVHMPAANITFTGAPAFSANFLVADAGGVIYAQSLVLTGAPTGNGWITSHGGYLDTNGTTAAITGAGFGAGTNPSGYVS